MLGSDFEKTGRIDMDFSSMLRFEECMQYFDLWLNKKMDGKIGSLKIKKITGNKNYVEWISDKKKTNGIIIDNPARFNSSNAVGIFFLDGQKHTVQIKQAIKDIEGENGPTEEMLKTRYKEAISALEQNKPTQFKAIDLEKQTKESEEANAKKFYEDSKADYLSRLKSVAVAQYSFLLAKAMKDTVYHFGQKAQHIQDTRYIKKKNFTINQDVEDIYIMPKEKVPTLELMRKFVKSDHFKIPNNEYSFNKNDVLKLFDSFNLRDYFHDSDLKDGIPIFPSRNRDGVIVNIQKNLNTPIVNRDGSTTDKLFLPNAPTDDSCYIFNYHKKLENNPSYQPKTILINEGWATGRTINPLVEKDPLTLNVVAWSAVQVEKTLKNYLERYPQALIILVSDNDCKSFFKMNTKEGDQAKLDRVINTGLITSLRAYNNNIEDQHRIGVIIPRINYKKLTNDKILSDFNDIENSYGQDVVKNEITSELTKLYERKANQINEADRIVKLYNQQAQYFSNKYGLSVNGIDLDANLGAVKITPQETERQEVVSLNKQSENQNNQPNDKVQTYSSGFFDVPINENIKSAVDREIERSISVVVDHNPAPVSNIPLSHEDIQQLTATNHIAPHNNAPSNQPLLDPAIFTLVLHQNILISQFSDIGKNQSKDDMMNALDRNIESMNNTLRTLNILIDESMLKHVPKTLDKYIEKYKDQPFLSDLVEIRSFANEQFIQKSALDIAKLQDFHKTTTEIFIDAHKENGLDGEVVKKMGMAAISKKPIEEKRVFFKHFIQALDALNVDNSKWLSEVMETLNKSVGMAQDRQRVKNHESNKPSYNSSYDYD